MSYFGDYAKIVSDWRYLEMRVRKRYQNTFRVKVFERIQEMDAEIILFSDLQDLGSRRQINRALCVLIEEDKLVRIGLGIYSKAEQSEYLDYPIIRAGFDNACIEALERLGIEWDYSQPIKDYNKGRSQQVPANLEVRLKSRCRRKFNYGNRTLLFEGMINAK